VSELRAEAERRRHAELEAMRAQVARLREAAAEHARSAASAAVATEVARARAMTVPAARQPSFVPPPPAVRRPMPRWVRAALPIAASLAVLALGGYLLDLGPALTGTTSAATEWLKGLGGSGEAPEPEPETTPPSPAEQPQPRAAAERRPRTGSLRVTSDPPGATVLLDGESRGTAPLDLSDIPAGQHTLELRSDAGTVSRSITVRAGTRTIAEESFGPGYVTILSKVTLDIHAGGRRIGSTDDDRIALPAGTHLLTLVSDRYRFRADLPVDVKSGEITPYTATLPSGRLVVHTTAGAEVFVEGELVGVAPIAPLEIPIGIRDIVARHQELGEKRVNMEIKRDQTTEITLAFGAATDETGRRTPRLAPLSAPPAPRVR
jgi:hypothetical protein